MIPKRMRMRTPTTELQAMAIMAHTERPVLGSGSMADGTVVSRLMITSQVDQRAATGATLGILPPQHAPNSPGVRYPCVCTVLQCPLLLCALWQQNAFIYNLTAILTQLFVWRELFLRSRSPNSLRAFDNMAGQQEQGGQHP